MSYKVTESGELPYSSHGETHSPRSAQHSGGCPPLGPSCHQHQHGDLMLCPRTHGHRLPGQPGARGGWLTDGQADRPL